MKKSFIRKVKKKTNESLLLSKDDDAVLLSDSTPIIRLNLASSKSKPQVQETSIQLPKSAVNTNSSQENVSKIFVNTPNPILLIDSTSRSKRSFSPEFEADTELLEVDCKLDDSALKTSLVKKLVQVGGDSLKDTVKRMFPKIVEDHVLKQYSWVGGKGKKKFSLLKLTDVIKDVCKQNPNTKLYTEKAVEDVIAVFLTKASERCSRKANKDIAKGTL